MVNKLNDVFWPEDVSYILQTPLSVLTTKDGWVWHYDKNGSYSVKSGYKTYMSEKISSSSSNSESNQKVWKQIWKLNVYLETKVC